MAKSIIIFETSGKLSHLLTSRLKEENAEVFVTRKEREMQRKLVGNRPDVVLLDLISYDGNPEDLAASVKNASPTSKIVVVKNPKMGLKIVDALQRKGVAMFLNAVTNFQEILFVVNLLFYPEFKNTRKNLRTIASLTVKFEGGGRTGQGRSFNISKGGLFVQTKEEVKEGERLNFAFQLRYDDKEMSLPGKVIWINRFGADYKKSFPIGFAVVFDKLPKDKESVIEEFVVTELKRRYHISNSLL